MANATINHRLFKKYYSGSFIHNIAGKYSFTGTKISGGSKGREGRAPPQLPNSFNFMQFLGNFGKIIC